MWHVLETGKMAYWLLGGGEGGGTRPLGRFRSKWEDNIKMDLQDVGWETWTGFIWLRSRIGVGPYECGNKPSDSIKLGKFLD
jgi:hypothetical protein